MDHEKATEAATTTVQSASELSDWSSQDEGRIRRKIDWRIMPVVLLLYLVSFIDRSNIGNARILGMSVDLDLIGNRFNVAMTVFYVFYVCGAIPANIGLKVVGGRYWMSGIIMIFGLIVMCHAFLKSYASLLGLRVILGLSEGGALPGFAFYLSLFYRRHELALRISLFMSGASLAGAFGGLLAAGLASIPSWGTSALIIDRWRNVFLFEGIISILLGFGGLFVLPNGPEVVKTLTPSDRRIAAARIQQDHQEHAKEKMRSYHIVRGIFNINNTIFGLGLLCATVSVTSLSIFLPTLLHDLGYGSIKANLMSVPIFAVAAVFTVTVALLSDRAQKRGPYIIGCALVSIIGWAILISHTSNRIKYMAVFFAACGPFATGPLYICWTLNNAAGPTIRAVSVGYMTSWSHVGALLAIWSYLPKDGPEYIRGHSINLGANCLTVLVAATAMAYCKWENSMRDQGARDHRLQGLTAEQESRLGYRHPRVRYTT